MSCKTIVVRSREDALRKMSAALRSGECEDVVSIAQCLWVLCDEHEFTGLLDVLCGEMDQLLDQEQLSPGACDNISEGLTVARANAQQEYLLAGAAA